MDWEDYLRDDGEYDVREYKSESKELPEFGVASEKSLYEYLLEQLSYLKLVRRGHRNRASSLSATLTSRVFLSCSVEELAETLKATPERVERILMKIQRFDPPGVGARDLKESLMLQLRERGIDNNLAYRIVEEQLETLDRKSHLQIAKTLGVTWSGYKKRWTSSRRCHRIRLTDDLRVPRRR